MGELHRLPSPIGTNPNPPEETPETEYERLLAVHSLEECLDRKVQSSRNRDTARRLKRRQQG